MFANEFNTAGLKGIMCGLQLWHKYAHIVKQGLFVKRLTLLKFYTLFKTGFETLGIQ